ncbi:MAG: hypothetical protein HC807_05870 [Gammaproteobacteria bacterium]|nr:hypothetical protein [Gammaproteobacteria bacterium]
MAETTRSAVGPAGHTRTRYEPCVAASPVQSTVTSEPLIVTASIVASESVCAVLTFCTTVPSPDDSVYAPFSAGWKCQHTERSGAMPTGW